MNTRSLEATNKQGADLPEPCALSCSYLNVGFNLRNEDQPKQKNRGAIFVCNSISYNFCLSTKVA